MAFGEMQTVYAGLDIGSTTIKAVATDGSGRVVFSRYERHGARISEKVGAMLTALGETVGDVPVSLTVTGSIGMGLAERTGLPFIQEVVSATRYMHEQHPEITTMIDIGGEDAKVVFFREGQSPDLRMNGNCAGGTGAFIDQMAILLDVSIDDLNRLALQSERIYPIASRCGVFCKTDIQNLVAKNASRADIAASIFHAVAVQTVVTLSRGNTIGCPVLFCGGPLTFIPALRHAFADYLGLDDGAIVLPRHSELIPAWGAAIESRHHGEQTLRLSELTERLRQAPTSTYEGSRQLTALFSSEEERRVWQQEKLHHRIPTASLTAGHHEVTLGIDSGSTTTKIVVLDDQGRLLYSFYSPNRGNPIGTVAEGLRALQNQCEQAGAELTVVGSQSTGYGEDLIQVAFGLDGGIIETIAHYVAARHIRPEVSFILDIGGQDMKAIFVEQGVINHIEINEACSSGCGTFIETFAKSMGYTVEQFADAACNGHRPCDLGTRCTVFMNSKVKQVLREGATIGDIAAGLSYSVINNCLHKVLKLKNTRQLGNHIVVQGGTMHNDSVTRALEILTGKEVYRSDRPELMGAYGCALHARWHRSQGTSLGEMTALAQFETKTLQCHGCENNCLVNRYTFRNGDHYFSGNKCERIFTNKGNQTGTGTNMYTEKLRLLFDRTPAEPLPADAPTIGLPRALGMYEEYPFWHTLFTRCGLRVVLSEASTYRQYESGVRSVMSDNICFPAKLMHSHILNLQEQGVDRIFLPYVVYERQGQGQNSYNCPVVTGYSDVIRSAMDLTVPVDSPAITFKDPKALRRQVKDYLATLGVRPRKAGMALKAALEAYAEFESEVARLNRETYEKAHATGRLTILLAGRPYHSDPLVQHKLSDMVCALGADCITDDVVRGMDIDISDVHFMSQWAYPEHILKAAKWAAQQGPDVQFVELTSFGCGPDAFMLDEIHGLLQRHGKALTQLKIDDVCNVGSLKLRVRSVVDSLRLNQWNGETHDSDIRFSTKPFVTTPVFTEEERHRRRKIIIPYFTSFITPLIPSFMKVAGYDAEVLPLSDPQSGDLGLQFANNEVCYPATLIVGDIVKAFRSGRYNPDTTTALITQTGGQCRASNYISLIKKALVEAGYAQVPVVSLSTSSNLRNLQPGFRIHFRRLIPIALSAILYSDAIAKMYFAAAPREREPGQAARLRDKYLDMARSPIERNQSRELLSYLPAAAKDFDRISLDRDCPRVGIVGEIFLKFNPYAQRGLTQWLVDRHFEVVAPVLLDFFLQSFVNQDVKRRTRVERQRVPRIVSRTLYRLVRYRINQVNRACAAYRYYQPFGDVYTLAQNAREVVSLSAQFGEGWLLPGEVATLAREGVRHVVSLQPFGCIANHIIARGVERRLRALFPGLNFLTLDFDSGVSDVNVTNRLLLFANDLIVQD